MCKVAASPGLRCKMVPGILRPSYIASTAQSVLNGEGTCENICDAQKNSDEDPIAKCVKKLDVGYKIWMAVLAFFPVEFAISMAVFCD